MSKEIIFTYNAITLPATEMNVLKELEQTLQKNGSLKEGATLPLTSKNNIGRSETNISFYVENNSFLSPQSYHVYINKGPPKKSVPKSKLVRI